MIENALEVLRRRIFNYCNLLVLVVAVTIVMNIIRARFGQIKD